MSENNTAHEWTPQEVAERLRTDRQLWDERHEIYYDFRGNRPCGCALGKLYHTINPVHEHLFYRNLMYELANHIPLKRQTLIEDLHANEDLTIIQIAEIIDTCASWEEFEYAYDYVLGDEVIV